MSKNFVQHRGCKKLAAIKPPNLFCLLSVELAGKSSVGIRISWLILPLLLCQIFTFSSRKTETKIIIYLHSNAKQNQKQTKDSTVGTNLRANISCWCQTDWMLDSSVTLFPAKGGCQKKKFFWDIFPKCGWVGWLIPKQCSNPSKPPKSPRKSPFSTQISPFVFPNLTKTLGWVGG